MHKFYDRLHTVFNDTLNQHIDDTCRITDVNEEVETALQNLSVSHSPKTTTKPIPFTKSRSRENDLKQPKKLDQITSQEFNSELAHAQKRIENLLHDIHADEDELQTTLDLLNYTRQRLQNQNTILDSKRSQLHDLRLSLIKKGSGSMKNSLKEESHIEALPCFDPEVNSITEIKRAEMYRAVAKELKMLGEPEQESEPLEEPEVDQFTLDSTS